MENIDITTCENCLFFVKHYVFIDRRFTYAQCGHCRRNLKASPLNKNFGACKRFELLTEKMLDEKIESNLENKINDIQKTLTHLKDYIENNKREN